MPSTYSSLKIQLMATGENNTTWGDVTNLNLGTALEEAIVGSADVPFSSADVTLTLTDTNASQTARNMRLNLTGTATAGYNLIVPAIEKPYIINNATDGTITVKNATGTGIAVPAGKTMWVYNNGTNVVDAVTRLSSLTLGTDLAVADGGTGASTFTSNGVLIGNGTSAISATAAGTTGQVLVGNTGGAPSWATLSGIGVTSFSAGTTGLTPSTGTTGAITLAGTLGVTNGGTGTSTQFTAGSVVFAGASGVYSQSNANLFWDNSNNRLGIGTSSPTEKLDVNGVIKGGVAAGVTLLMADSSAIRNTATGGNTMYFDSGVGSGSTTGDFNFRSTASYTSRLYIDGSTGRVGIGTSSPTFRLVSADSTTDGGWLYSASTVSILGLGGYSGATDGAFSLRYNRGTGDTTFNGGSRDTPLERMRLDAGGNLGIGTTSPQRPLHVAYLSSNVGAYTAILQGQTGGYGAGVSFQSNLTGGSLAEMARITADGEAAWNTTASTQDAGLRFYTALDGTVAEKMRLNSDGNLGIGTSSPSQKLTVQGAQLTIPAAGWSSGQTAYLYLGDTVNGISNTNGGYSTYFNFNGHSWNVNGTEAMRIDGARNVGIGTSSPGNKLDVVGNAQASNLYINATAGTLGMADNSASFILYNGTGAGGITNTIRMVTSGAERMRIDSSGNVGIGTTPSGDRLNVAGTGQFTAASYCFVGVTSGSVQGQMAANGSGATVDIRAVSNHPMTFFTNNTERMRIDSSGNVGIGTSSTGAAKLVVAGGNGIVVNGNGTSGYNVAQFINDNAVSLSVGVSGSAAAGWTQNLAHVGTNSNSPLVFGTNSTERARIDSSGNLLVGTTTPTYSTSGRGLLEVNGSSSALIAIKTGDTARGYFAASSSATELSAVGGSQPLLFTTNSAERMRITSSGDLLVGTTDVGSSSGTGVKLLPTGYVFAVAPSTTNDTYNYYNTTAGAYRFYVNNAGTIYATSTTISAISDIRLKENVRELDAGLDVILALKPRRFDWKEGKGKDVKDDMGFIAQEVEEVLPALIGDWKAGEGEPDDLKSVKAGDLIPVLVKAIQELTARVAQLEGN